VVFTLDATSLALLVVLAAIGHWLVARSEIARPLWERAHGKLDRLLRCVACTAVWLGLGLGVAGLRPVRWVVFDHWRWLQASADVATSVLLAAFGAPIAQAVFLWARDMTAIPDPEPPRDKDGRAISASRIGPR